MDEKKTSIATCFHESEEELSHMLSCDHADLIYYDRSNPENAHIEDLFRNIQQKEKRMKCYEIGSRSENPEELFKFEEIFSDRNKSDNCFENYSDFNLPDIYSTQKQLKISLKDKYENYQHILRSWFSSEIDHEQFEKSINSLLAEISLKKMHNEYMLAIFHQANRSEQNVVDDFLYFLDSFFDPIENGKISNDELNFIDFICSNNETYQDDMKTHENDKNDNYLIDNDENIEKSFNDDDDLMIIKKRKRKRCFRIFDDDEERSDAENSGGDALENHLSDDDLNSVTKKKRKRKTMLISSDEDSGNDDENIYYETESSNSNANLFELSSNDLKTIDVKSTGPLKTTITITNTKQPITTNNRNFSLLSKILNSDTPISNLDDWEMKKISGESNDKSIKNDGDLVLSNENAMMNMSVDSDEPFNNVSNCFDDDSNQQNQKSNLSFPSFFLSSNAKIAELLSFQPSGSQQESVEFSEMSPLSSFSPLVQSTATVDSLSNLDDMSNKSENFVDNQMKLNSYQKAESINLNTDEMNNKCAKSIQSFEIFDPIMDASLNTLEDTIKTRELNDEQRKLSENDMSVLSVKAMSSEEEMTKLQTCFQEVALPDNVRLGLRISQLATLQGFSSVDRKVTHLCNLALKNFIRNILTQLIASRNSFLIRKNRIIYNVGAEPINPYLRNTFQLAQKELYPNLNVSPISSFPLAKNDLKDCINKQFDNESEEYSNYLRLTSILDSKLRLKRYGLNRNEMLFNHNDQIKLISKDETINDNSNKLRCTSRALYVPDWQNKFTSYGEANSCNLYHLYDLLNTNRSLIPVTPVWSRTLYRTVSAFNNLTDSDK